MNETESTDATPEELLKVLELRMAMQRAQRTGTGRNRMIFLAGGVFFILIAAGVALVVLSQMAGEMRNARRDSAGMAGARPATRNF